MEAEKVAKAEETRLKAEKKKRRLKRMMELAAWATKKVLQES